MQLVNQFAAAIVQSTPGKIGRPRGLKPIKPKTVFTGQTSRLIETPVKKFLGLIGFKPLGRPNLPGIVAKGRLSQAVIEELLFNTEWLYPHLVACMEGGMCSPEGLWKKKCCKKTTPLYLKLSRKRR